jgi:type IV pilus assembly protein PilW
MHQQRGVGLIELMVAMLIGLFLILGAVTVFNQSRNTYRASEGVARLQETARLAMDVIESDIRMANYWGLNNRADYIVNRAAPLQTPPATFSAAQRSSVSICGGAGSNWVINLDEYIGGFNNTDGLIGAGCESSNHQDGSDMVIIRRANETRPVTLDPNRVYLQTSRIQGTLFVPPAGCTDPTDQDCIPAAYLPPASESRELESRVYYVSSQSTLRADVPSLRRKRFANVNTPSNAMLDEEIVSGVEDLQVRLGVDTNGDSNIDQYVNPGGVPGNAAVVSVTVWLLVRAEDRDFGHRDETPYQYADMAAAFTPNDNYRRILVSKTIHIRNSRI